VFAKLDDMNPVQSLSPGIAAYLRSSVNITSLASVLEQLLKNALEANAHHIRVNLNLEQWSLTVQDDGEGIDGSQLEAVGRRYCTSEKAGSQDPYFWKLTSCNLLDTSKTLQTHGLTPLESFAYRGEGKLCSNN
jgi:DNA mismatch repair ATPase MutL